MTVTPAAEALLGARYRLVSLIAAGGMGEVWSATDEVLGRNVAVKVLRREYADDPEFRPSSAGQLARELLDTPVTVLVRATDYVGRPVADASAAVRALGLTVALRPAGTAPGAAIDSVTAVTPTGRLRPDATVTLEVARAPAGPGDKKGKP